MWRFRVWLVVVDSGFERVRVFEGLSPVPIEDLGFFDLPVSSFDDAWEGDLSLCDGGGIAFSRATPTWAC